MPHKSSKIHCVECCIMNAASVFTVFDYDGAVQRGTCFTAPVSGVLSVRQRTNKLVAISNLTTLTNR